MPEQSRSCCFQRTVSSLESCNYFGLVILSLMMVSLAVHGGYLSIWATINRYYRLRLAVSGLH